MVNSQNLVIYKWEEIWVLFFFPPPSLLTIRGFDQTFQNYIPDIFVCQKTTPQTKKVLVQKV